MLHWNDAQKKEAAEALINHYKLLIIAYYEPDFFRTLKGDKKDAGAFLEEYRPRLPHSIILELFDQYKKTKINIMNFFNLYPSEDAVQNFLQLNEDQAQKDIQRLKEQHKDTNDPERLLELYKQEEDRKPHKPTPEEQRLMLEKINLTRAGRQLTLGEAINDYIFRDRACRDAMVSFVLANFSKFQSLLEFIRLNKTSSHFKTIANEYEKSIDATIERMTKGKRTFALKHFKQPLKQIPARVVKGAQAALVKGAGAAALAATAGAAAKAATEEAAAKVVTAGGKAKAATAGVAKAAKAAAQAALRRSSKK